MNHLGLITSILAAAMAVTGCHEQDGPVATGYEQLPAEQVMLGARQTMYSNGVRSAVGVFDTLYVFADSVVGSGVNVDMFGPDGDRTGTLTAESGMIMKDSQLMVARGDVVLIALENNQRIETEELYYDPTVRQVWSDVHTCRMDQGTVYEMSSFRSDDRFDVFTMQELVTRPGNSC